MTVDVATVGAIIGSLIGVVSLLLRFLVVTKNQHIKALETELQDVLRERDLFRDLTLTRRRD